MEPRPGLIAQDVGEDRQPAPDRSRFGRPRPAAQAEHRRHEPLVRLGALGQGGILGMVDDRPAEHAGVEQPVAQDRGRADRGAVVAEPDGTGVTQLAERGQRLAPAAEGHRAVGQELDRRAGGRRGRENPAEDARVVDRRARVGHDADRREAAVGCRRKAGRDRFRVLEAGLAKVGVEVDEARRDDHPVRLDPRPIGPIQPGDGLDPAIGHDDLAGTLAIGDRVDEPGPADLEIGDQPADLGRPARRPIDRTDASGSAFLRHWAPRLRRAGRGAPFGPLPRSSPGR